MSTPSKSTSTSDNQEAEAALLKVAKAEAMVSIRDRANKKKPQLPPRIDRIMQESSEDFINSFTIPEVQKELIDTDMQRQVDMMCWEFVQGVPEGYRFARLNQFSDSTRQIADDWIRSRSWLLYVQGDNGTGKTHLGFATARASITLNLAPASWMSTPDLLADLRAAFNKPYKGIVENVRSFKGLLLLDDIGAEKDTEFSIQELYRILYYREAWRLKTIVTCNYSITELATKLDGRIASRLAGGQSIVLKGRDRRLSKGGQS